ncbi:MAG: Na+/H+ antiporter NhaA, partial [Gammaproteobacteria bacterium]|nr:Na+/H+ antiporter NhaA [Gammaproteobacteria bacterium]
MESGVSVPVKALRNFLRLESAGGILLIVGAVLAMVLSNSPLREAYDALLNLRLAVTVGDIALDKPLLLWINDGLMAIFFFLIGLEIKREVLEGQLSSRDQIALPAISAVGGFVVPVLIYAWFNNGNIQAMNGWAIPAATDIAFALGILSLLGNRVPLSLKIFLTSVAIFDDVAAIVVIALFYSEDLSLLALILA